MHADEVDVDAPLVRRMLRACFPQHADQDVRRWSSGGTVNAIFRVGDGLSARLPLTAGGVAGIRREEQWLPLLARAVPVPVPTVVGVGEPVEGFPWRWALHGWIDGAVLLEGRMTDPAGVAAALAGVVVGLRGADPTDAPAAHRGGTLADVDDEVRSAIDQLTESSEPFDAAAATAAWSAALAVPPWPSPPCWIHSDLMPSNLLTDGATLTAVIDFSTAGLGDPAVDLIPAWNLLPPHVRTVFRDLVDVDDDTWERGRGWALSMALVQLPYYRRSNPVISANARFVLRQVLTSH